MTVEQQKAKLAAYEDALDRAIMGETEITVRWDDKEITFSRPNIGELKNRIREMKAELGQGKPRFYNVRF